MAFGEFTEAHFHKDDASVEADAQPEGAGQLTCHAGHPAQNEDGAEAGQPEARFRKLMECAGKELETGKPVHWTCQGFLVWLEEVERGEEEGDGQQRSAGGHVALENSKEDATEETFFEESDHGGAESEFGNAAPWEHGFPLVDSEGDVDRGHDSDGDGCDGETGEQVASPAWVGDETEALKAVESQGARQGPEQAESGDEHGAVEVFFESHSLQGGEDAVLGKRFAGPEKGWSQKASEQYYADEVSEDFGGIFQKSLW